MKYIISRDVVITIKYAGHSECFVSCELEDTAKNRKFMQDCKVYINIYKNDLNIFEKRFREFALKKYCYYIKVKKIGE